MLRDAGDEAVADIKCEFLHRWAGDGVARLQREADGGGGDCVSGELSAHIRRERGEVAEAAGEGDLQSLTRQRFLRCRCFRWRRAGGVGGLCRRVVRAADDGVGEERRGDVALL